VSALRQELALAEAENTRLNAKLVRSFNYFSRPVCLVLMCGHQNEVGDAENKVDALRRELENVASFAEQERQAHTAEIERLTAALTSARADAAAVRQSSPSSHSLTLFRRCRTSMSLPSCGVGWMWSR
jgi:hypothetical protein